MGVTRRPEGVTNIARRLEDVTHVARRPEGMATITRGLWGVTNIARRPEGVARVIRDQRWPDYGGLQWRCQRVRGRRG